jgi:hypothetical protein
MSENLILREFLATRLMGGYLLMKGVVRESGSREPRKGVLISGLPAYESDPAAMMLVIEAMRAKGWKLAYLRHAASGDDGFDACFRKGPMVESASDIANPYLAVAFAARAALEASDGK